MEEWINPDGVSNGDLYNLLQYKKEPLLGTYTLSVDTYATTTDDVQFPTIKDEKLVPQSLVKISKERNDPNGVHQRIIFNFGSIKGEPDVVTIRVIRQNEALLSSQCESEYLSVQNNRVVTEEWNKGKDNQKFIMHHQTNIVNGKEITFCTIQSKKTKEYLGVDMRREIHARPGDPQVFHMEKVNVDCEPSEPHKSCNIL